MGTFVLAAALLVVITLLLLLRPWRRSAPHDVATAREINTGIYRDQLHELDRDLTTGTIASADHEQARAELQRRLLDDAKAGEVAASATQGMGRTSLLLVLAVPVLATALYAWLGKPAAIDPVAARAVMQGEVERMVAGLAARLEMNPGDAKGWVVLARSYRVMGRLQEAQQAFERIGAELDRDAMLLAEYADVLAARANGNLEGKPLELVMRALKIDPDNPAALSLAATAAFNRRDLPQATAYWEHVLKLVPPESDDAKWLVKTLAQIRGPAESASAAQATPAPSAGRSAEGEAVRGRVSLAPELAAKVLPTDTVFVFVRAAQGARMPLAVQRVRVADLPFDFKLDDTMAMSPASKLSGASEVRVEARISRTGNATPGPGDLIGVGPVVKPGASEVAVRIDQVRP